MTNVIYPRQFHSRVTSASKGVGFVSKVLALAKTNAMTPAWITEVPLLNRAVSLLRQRGWKIDCYAKPCILCFHPRVKNIGGVNIVDAMEIQMIFDAQNEGGNAA